MLFALLYFQLVIFITQVPLTGTDTGKRWGRKCTSVADGKPVFVWARLKHSTWMPCNLATKTHASLSLPLAGCCCCWWRSNIRSSKEMRWFACIFSSPYVIPSHHKAGTHLSKQQTLVKPSRTVFAHAWVQFGAVVCVCLLKIRKQYDERWSSSSVLPRVLRMLLGLFFVSKREPRRC